MTGPNRLWHVRAYSVPGVRLTSLPLASFGLRTPVEPALSARIFLAPIRRDPSQVATARVGRNGPSGLSLCSLPGLRPHGKLIATGLQKVEAAAAGEVEQRTDYLAAVLLHLGQGGLDVGAVEHQQGAAVGGLAAGVGTVDAAVQALVGEGAVVGAVIGKLPAEHGGKEGLGGRQIPGGKFHVVELFVLQHLSFPGVGRWRPLRLPPLADGNQQAGLAKQESMLASNGAGANWLSHESGNMG